MKTKKKTDKQKQIERNTRREIKRIIDSHKWELDMEMSIKMAHPIYRALS